MRRAGPPQMALSSTSPLARWLLLYCVHSLTLLLAELVVRVVTCTQVTLPICMTPRPLGGPVSLLSRGKVPRVGICKNSRSAARLSVCNTNMIQQRRGGMPILVSTLLPFLWALVCTVCTCFVCLSSFTGWALAAPQAFNLAAPESRYIIAGKRSCIRSVFDPSRLCLGRLKFKLTTHRLPPPHSL